MTDVSRLSGRPPARSGCSRIGCRSRPVVLLRLGSGVLVSYCLGHADDVAGRADVEVVWVASGFAICALCGRPLPARLALSPHFTHLGEPCPTGGCGPLIMAG